MEKKVEATVSLHSSGRRTLMLKNLGESMPQDCKEPGLFGNPSAVMFYRALGEKIASLSREGKVVFLNDQSETSPKSDLLMLGVEAHKVIKIFFPNDSDEGIGKGLAAAANALNGQGLISVANMVKHYKDNR